MDPMLKMASIQGTVSAAERSLRSVFVGNIPYEATEEQLKDIFAEVGPVVSFGLVYDRETGKPKGYGFCEYKDQETALSAMRNLNGYELNGRPLRVDNAASEKSKEELKNLQASIGGPPIESPYGIEVEPDKAPEAISRAVASLPPEQMFELMKQMKLCIQNNPNEARNMLLQNPQLAYALLQAQVIMKIVDPHVALGMLHRQNPIPTPIMPVEMEPPQPAPVGMPNNNFNPQGHVMGNEFVYGEAVFHGGQMPGAPMVRPGLHPAAPRPALLGDRPMPVPMQPEPVGPRPPAPAIQVMPQVGPPFQDRGDRDMRGPPMADRDMRAPMPIPMVMGDHDLRQPMGDQDLRRPMSPPRNEYDPRFRGGGGPPPAGPFMGRPMEQNRGQFDNRGPNVRPEDPRTVTVGMNMQQQQQQRPMQRMPAPAPQQQAPPPRPAGPPVIPGISPQDHEKAALIMQVLQLSEQQIALLPPEQRQSIMILKDQIARSAQ